MGKHSFDGLKEHGLVLAHQQKQMHQALYAINNVVFPDVVWKLSQQVIQQVVNTFVLHVPVVLADVRLQLVVQVLHVASILVLFNYLGTYFYGVHDESNFGLSPFLEGHPAFKPKNSDLEDKLTLLYVQVFSGRLVVRVTLHLDITDLKLVKLNF